MDVGPADMWRAIRARDEHLRSDRRRCRTTFPSRDGQPTGLPVRLVLQARRAPTLTLLFRLEVRLSERLKRPSCFLVGEPEAVRADAAQLLGRDCFDELGGDEAARDRSEGDP